LSTSILERTGGLAVDISERAMELLDELLTLNTP